MKSRKTVAVNGRDIAVTHEVRIDQKHQTAIHLTATHENVTLNHVMTIGAEDQPLPADYSAESLQADVDKACNKLAALVESKHRAAVLAKRIA